jgi:hypothetical protein
LNGRQQFQKRVWIAQEHLWQELNALLQPGEEQDGKYGAVVLVFSVSAGSVLEEWPVEAVPGVTYRSANAARVRLALRYLAWWIAAKTDIEASDATTREATAYADSWFASAPPFSSKAGTLAVEEQCVMEVNRLLGMPSDFDEPETDVILAMFAPGRRLVRIVDNLAALVTTGRSGDLDLEGGEGPVPPQD